MPETLRRTSRSSFVERPSEMPRWYREWADEVGLQRAVCDYLAGMTDRFAELEHARLRGYGPARRDAPAWEASP